jgi:hypothetical protein
LTWKNISLTLVSPFSTVHKLRDCCLRCGPAAILSLQIVCMAGGSNWRQPNLFHLYSWRVGLLGRCTLCVCAWAVTWVTKSKPWVVVLRGDRELLSLYHKLLCWGMLAYSVCWHGHLSLDYACLCMTICLTWTIEVFCVYSDWYKWHLCSPISKEVNLCFFSKFWHYILLI